MTLDQNNPSRSDCSIDSLWTFSVSNTSQLTYRSVVFISYDVLANLQWLTGLQQITPLQSNSIHVCS